MAILGKQIIKYMTEYLKGQTGELQTHAKRQEWSEEKRDALVAAIFRPAVTLYYITREQTK